LLLARAVGVDSPEGFDTVEPETLAGQVQGIPADRFREWRGELAT